jgi:hypothetical protein
MEMDAQISSRPAVPPPVDRVRRQKCLHGCNREKAPDTEFKAFQQMRCGNGRIGWAAGGLGPSISGLAMHNPRNLNPADLDPDETAHLLGTKITFAGGLAEFRFHGF